MIDRNNLPATEIKRGQALSEIDKVFDESMTSLIEWLKTAQKEGFFDHSKAIEIFKEELKQRRGHEL